MICFVPSLSLAQSGVQGLSYQTYRGTGATPNTSPLFYPTPLSTGVSSTINFNWGGGGVLNSGRTEQVIVRWTGFINIPAAGLYSFGGNADDGLRININNTSVVDSWIEAGGQFRSGNVNLPAGAVPIEIWYYENGGGAMVNLQWYVQSTGTWEIVPASMLATSANYWAPPPVVSPSAVYRDSAITSAQSARRALNFAASTGNQAEVSITGDTNDVYILQAGSAGHFASVNVVGNTNRVEVKQNTLVGARHYLEASIVGNSNVLNLNQSGSNKTQIVSVVGNSNNVTTNQVGTGNHFLDLSVTGNNHTATVTQSGSGNHEARVTLDGTQPWNFNLTQQGSTSQKYTLPHDMSNGSVVNGTCMVIGGCNLTVNQQ